MNHSKFRYVFGILFLILLIGSFYLIDLLISNKPYKTVTPDVYEKGTVVSLYDKLPKAFPVELVLKDFVLDYVGEVKNPVGKVDVTISFLSPSDVLYIVNSYRSKLSENGWKVSVDLVSKEVAVVIITKNNTEIMLSVATGEENGSIITIQYEK